MKSMARHLLLDTFWQEDALCAQPEYRNLMWFPDEDWSRARKQLEFQRTRSICRSCPVIAECRVYAEKAQVTSGIWAGKDYNRQTMVKKHRKKVQE